MKIDLHLHSRYSDGTLWPAEVAERAAAAGLGLAALTDHDSMEGAAEFAEAGRRLGLRVVAAAEVDCVAPEIGFDGELLAYFPPGQGEDTAAFLRERLQARESRMGRLLASVGERWGRREPTLASLRAFKVGPGGEGGRGGVLTYSKIDLYRYLQTLGALPEGLDYRAFKSALAEVETGEPWFKPHARDVVGRVRSEGGVVVAAHPGYLLAKDPSPSAEGAERLGRIFEALRGWGLWGAELYHYEGLDTAGLNALVSAAARPLGLAFTWGSDCHGPGSATDRMGRFWGELPRPAAPSADGYELLRTLAR